MARFDYPLIVVGAGAGGLVVAIGAAKAGKRVLLIERGTWGGDCTNFGCIPSKTLIAAAEQGDREGALARVRAVVKQVREHEEPAALEKHGIELLTGVARFLDGHTLEVNGKQVSGKQIVLAAGSSPRVPEAVAGVPHLTNETIFDLEQIPRRLAVLGGGPIGCELGQAFQRLGSEVTLFHSHGCLLNREEPEAQAAVKQQLLEEGMEVLCNAKVQQVEMRGDEIVVEGRPFDQLLVSVGRKPNIEELGLEAAGVESGERGIVVDSCGRTNVKHIYAIGDINGIAPFTHVAENQGRAVLMSLLLPFKKRWSTQAVPRVTYTDPEVASAGMSEAEARERFGKGVAIYHQPMSGVDRAITAGRTEGLIKIITRKWSSRILGVCIVAPRAGEMLSEVTLAMKMGIPLRKLADLIHPYPTYSLGIRQAADKWLTQTVLRR